FLYRRSDYEIGNDKKQKLKNLLDNKIPDALKSGGATQPLKLDGYKYFFEDKSWIMIRPSGTENVVRIYAESDTSKKLDYLHELGKKVIEAC
ncbi:MAG: phosphoglucomutase/phosphomannomutase family protein, partial [Actinobacteria bacterium]|nr:phosphoglucomutase/phosphomannomutase family protein [Actinomycetota bacterium]